MEISGEVQNLPVYKGALWGSLIFGSRGPAELLHISCYNFDQGRAKVTHHSTSELAAALRTQRNQGFSFPPESDFPVATLDFGRKT